MIDPAPTARLDRMLALVRARVPGLRLVHKDDAWWMRGVAVLLRPFVPDFRTHYTTVIGRTVYLPRPPGEFAPGPLAATLAHELVHQLDQQRWGLLFYTSYAFGLPAFRTARAVWERRAYAVDLLIARETGGEAAVRRAAERLAELFTASDYLWMWVGRASARAFLEPTVEAVLSGALDGEEPYRSILAAWRGEAR